MKRETRNRHSNATLLTVVCVVVVFAFQTTPAHAQLTELYGFPYNASTTCNYPDGETPIAELIQGADGNYYTTTNTGGSAGNDSTMEQTR